jgi:hypothetical protein
MPLNAQICTILFLFSKNLTIDFSKNDLPKPAGDRQEKSNWESLFIVFSFKLFSTNAKAQACDSVPSTL